MENPKLIAGIASIPERQDALHDTINSILPQIDELHVFLNDYEYIPKFLFNFKIQIYRSQYICDKGDAGKFYKVSECKNCFYFSLDDDIIYPPDYIQKLTEKIEQYDRKKIISFHGAVIKEPVINSYWSGRQCYSCLYDVPADEPVHVGGTGVMGFYTDAIKICFEDFKTANMADMWIYKAAQEQQVGIICAQHPANWIILNPKVDQKKTIWEKYKHNDKKQLEIINSFPHREIF